MPRRPLISVLVSTVGCNTSIAVIKSLRLTKRYRYKIIGVDMRQQHEAAGSVFCDRYFQVPPIGNKQYVRALLAICKKEKVEVLLPVLDHDIEHIAKARSEFAAADIRVCASDLPTIVACNDKFATYTFLKKRAIAVPRTYRAHEALQLIGNLRFPLFVKPRRGTSSVDCFQANNKQQLCVLLSRVDQPIVQALGQGQQCVIDVVNDLEGKNLVCVPRHELSAKAGIGVKAVTVKDAALTSFAKQIAEALRIKGAANIEVFKQGKQLSLIEVNARYSAGVILSAMAGVNIPELAIDVFLNKPIAKTRLAWQAGWFMSRYWQEVFSRDKKIVVYR
ncbi:MAG: ATP-grasp domain-containing protein [Candidatus Omnitrophica bacterium]|nr:ATP-grasp domain-containing protein [Candidatus Omnitrophota bacterium]